MCEELSSRNIDPNWPKSKKTRGGGWDNAHKKLSSDSNSLSLAHNIPLHVLYRSPTLTTLSSHYVHRSGGAQCAKNTTPPASNFQRQEVFFCLNPTFSRIFRAITEQCNTTLFPYFILHLFYKNPIINLIIVSQRH